MLSLLATGSRFTGFSSSTTRDSERGTKCDGTQVDAERLGPHHLSKPNALLDIQKDCKFAATDFTLIQY